MAQARQRDDEWMVDYTESCLGGTAIRWYSGLDEDVGIDDRSDIVCRACHCACSVCQQVRHAVIDCVCVSDTNGISSYLAHREQMALY